MLSTTPPPRQTSRPKGAGAEATRSAAGHRPGVRRVSGPSARASGRYGSRSTKRKGPSSQVVRRHGPATPAQPYWRFCPLSAPAAAGGRGSPGRAARVRRRRTASATPSGASFGRVALLNTHRLVPAPNVMLQCNVAGPQRFVADRGGAHRLASRVPGAETHKGALLGNYLHPLVRSGLRRGEVRSTVLQCSILLFHSAALRSRPCWP